MAEEKNIVEEIEEEVKDLQSEQASANDTPTPAAENKVDETKTAITVPKWLVTTARAIEAVAAAFGALVAGLWIKDTVTKAKRRKKHYIDAPARRHEISYHPYENPASSVSEDLKVDTF